MKDKKCRIVIEFQADKDGVLKAAVAYLDRAISRITMTWSVTASIDYPEKYSPYPKP